MGPITPPKTPKRKAGSQGGRHSKVRTLGWYMKHPDVPLPRSGRYAVQKPKRGSGPFSRQAANKQAMGEGTVVKRKKTKGVAFKKVPIPKVSKKFKLKVETALASSLIRQAYTATYVGGNSNCKPGNDFQTVGSFSNADDGMALFSTDHYLDAASRLYNAKTGLISIGQFAPNSTGSFFVTAYKPLKFHVKSSSVRYTMKNNSLRTMYIRLYECAPKAKGSADFANLATISQGWVVNAATGAMTQAALNDAVVEPVTGWGKNLADDFIDGYSGQLSAGANVVQTTNMLGLTPQSSKSFKKSWKTDMKEIILLPGEGYEWNINGPSGIEMDYEKFLFNGNYQNVQKFTRFVFFTCKLDLCSGATTGAGRVNMNLATDLLTWERTDSFVLLMPELTAVSGRHDGFLKAVQPTKSTGASVVAEINNDLTMGAG